MHLNTIIASFLPLLSAIATAKIHKGFNYDSRGQTLESFTQSFKTAKSLVGAPGFTSARLFTTIQDGTTNTPISAIQAAIDTETSLLLGLFYPQVEQELAALTSAIAQYGDALKKLVVGISVGSEDLYRRSPTGMATQPNPGADPDAIIDFIRRTREAIAGTVLAATPIGHVDTWTAYVNSSNAGVIDAIDFLGVDAYPYYQSSMPNGIERAAALFTDAYDQTVAVAKGKPVWVTETGWPVSGPDSGAAIANTANAARYWQDVGCSKLFDKINTWWFILTDNRSPDVRDPRFPIVKSTGEPEYQLSCAAA